MTGALTLLLVSLAAAAPASKDGPTECPAPAQLSGALDALVAGLAPAAPTATPLLLASGQRLGVVTSPEGDVRVELVDGQGEVVLHRVLPAPPRGHAPDCAALAETIALIVDRYLHDVGYEAPPLPAPAPPPTAPPPVATPPTTLVVSPPVPAPTPRPRAVWRLGLYGGARRGDVGGFDGDGDLALGVEPARDGPRWGVRLSAGYAPAARASWMDKEATLRRVPLRVGVYRSRPLGPGRLEPGLGAGFELFLISSRGPGTAGGAHAAPSGDVSLGYTAALAGPLYLRLLSRAALTVPYTFKALDGSLVWGTSRFLAEIGVELGFAFP